MSFAGFHLSGWNETLHGGLGTSKVKEGVV